MFFERNDVKFVSVTQSLDTPNPMGRRLGNVRLDFAQIEREMTANSLGTNLITSCRSRDKSNAAKSNLPSLFSFHRHSPLWITIRMTLV
jgi:hypothetical protein